LADRHKTKPKAVRMPDGLLAWYEEHVKGTGLTVNGAIVAALEEYRDRHGGSTTAEAVAPPKRTRKPSMRGQQIIAAAPAPKTAPPPPPPPGRPAHAPTCRCGICKPAKK
jgi:hypothetical protein